MQILLEIYLEAKDDATIEDPEKCAIFSTICALKSVETIAFGGCNLEDIQRV
jgi:hypothetical protein